MYWNVFFLFWNVLILIMTCHIPAARLIATRKQQELSIADLSTFSIMYSICSPKSCPRCYFLADNVRVFMVACDKCVLLSYCCHCLRRMQCNIPLYHMSTLGHKISWYIAQVTWCIEERREKRRRQGGPCDGVTCKKYILSQNIRTGSSSQDDETVEAVSSVSCLLCTCLWWSTRQ